MNYNQHTDEALIELLKHGNEAAFDALYRRYWSKMYRLACQKLRNRDLAEELVQDLFISLWMKREVLQINTTVGAYLSMAVRYMIIKFFQKERVHQRYEQSIAGQPMYESTTENAIIFRDLQIIIEQEIDKLPTKCREVFQLSRHSNLSQKEISLKLNISEKTVENHISKALRLLRLSLKNFLSLLL